MDLSRICWTSGVLLCLILYQANNVHMLPYFSPSQFFIQKSETTPAGTTVATITASGGSGFTYSLSAVDKLNVGSSNGEITTVKEFDAEQEKEFAVTLTATDSSGNATATIRYFVLDANDNAPKFPNPYVVNVSENTNTGTTLVKVTAEDVDVDSNPNTLVYSITAGNSDGHFSMDAAGTLKLVKSLDYESKKVYTLDIQVKDNNGYDPSLSDTTTVTINVLDFDDMGPTFNASTYTATVKETATKGTFVVQVFAEDGDKGLNDKPTYSKITSSDLKNLFSIDGSTGVVTLSGNLSSETQTLHTFTVQAVTTDKTAALATVEVTVEDVNNYPPAFSQNYTGSVDENSPTGTSVLTVTAEDKDKGDNAVFNYTLSGADASSFSVDSSGVIKTAAAAVLDRETKDKYEFTVKAMETKTAEKFWGEATVVVTINDENDNNPEFTQQEYEFVVSEGDAGSVVGTVKAEDKDIGLSGQVKYKLTSDKFQIDADTGQITTKQALSGENRFTMTVVAEDQGSGSPRSDTVTVNVNVTKAPTFKLNSSLAENEAPASLLNVTSNLLKIVDANTSAAVSSAVSCQIIDGNSKSLFTLSSGCVLSTAQQLDREDLAQHILKVAYYSSNSTSSLVAIVAVTIDVLDKNDNVPKFADSQILLTIKESLAVGNLVKTVQATDTDTSPYAVIYYSIKSGNDDGFFSINESTGDIKVAKALDHELRKDVQLTVSASNSKTAGAASGDMTVHIQIEDANDNSPVFTKSIFVGILTEDKASSVDHKVTTISATDLDEGNYSAVVYNLVSGNGSSYFSLNEQTGEVKVKSAPTFTAGTMLELVVNAKDNYGNAPFNPATGTSKVQVYLVTDDMLTTLNLGVSEELVSIEEMQKMLEEITSNSSIVITSIASSPNSGTDIKFYTIKDNTVLTSEESHREIVSNSDLVNGKYKKWNVNLEFEPEPETPDSDDSGMGTMEAILLTIGICIGLFGLCAILAVIWYRKKEIEKIYEHRRKPSKVKFNDNPFFIEPDIAATDNFAPAPGQETQELALAMSAEDDAHSVGSNDSVVMIENPAFVPDGTMNNNKSTHFMHHMNGGVPMGAHYVPPPPSSAPPPPPQVPPLKSTYQIPRAQFLSLSSNHQPATNNDYEEIQTTPLSTFKPTPEQLDVIEESGEESAGEEESEGTGRESDGDSPESHDTHTPFLQNGFIHHSRANIPPPPPVQPPPTTPSPMSDQSLQHDQKIQILNDLREKFQNQPELVTHL